MRLTALFLSLTLSAVPAALAQAPAAHAKSATTAAKAPTKELLPFSGTWVLDKKKSKLITPIPGESKAIIIYDGKKWEYVHSHQESPEEEPEQWQTTLIVGSQKYDTKQGVDIVFHSRIARVGDAMVLTEHGETLRGQKTRNTVKYTLQEGGNVLIENETSVGPLGPEHNLYVLEREFSDAQKQAQQSAN